MRSVRNDIAASLLGFVMSSGATYMWLFFRYVGSRPPSPNPALGWVHALNDHGSYVYISATEATGLGLLFHMGFAAGLAAILIVPKDFILPRPGTARWLTYVSFAAKTDLARPTPRLIAIVIATALISLIAIYSLGPVIAAFAVSHGLILG